MFDNFAENAMIAFAAFVGGIIVAQLQYDPTADAHAPALVGYGCKGSAYGVLYADNEDSFPLCKRIERNVG